MKFIKLLGKAQFHGSGRLAERRDRRQWGTLLLFLFLLATSVVTLLVQRYLQNPTFVGHFHRFRMRVSFPMVAMCPEINYPEHRVNDFLKMIKIPSGLTESDIRLVINQLTAFYAPDVKFDLNDMEIVETVLELNKMTVEEAAMMLSSSCEETILKCSWAGRIVNCSTLFRLEMTRYGLCCVFNGRSLRLDWSQDPNKNKKSWSSYDVGPFSGITFVVNQSQNINDVDLSYKWLLVQDDSYYGDTTLNGSALSPGIEQWLMFNRIAYQVSEEATYLSDSLRKCRLSSENLKYFPIYNRKHCLLECELAKLIDHCNCIGVTYPPLPNVPICKADKIYCMKSIAVAYTDDQCDCPEACETQVGFYNIDSHSLVSTETTFDNIYADVDFNKTSVVRVFNACHGKLTLDRKSIVGLYDLYSQLGGVFNAFFGCSIVTLLELLQLFRYGVLALKDKLYRRPTEKYRVERQNISQLAIPEDATTITIKKPVEKPKRKEKFHVRWLHK